MSMFDGYQDSCLKGREGEGSYRAWKTLSLLFLCWVCLNKPILSRDPCFLKDVSAGLAMALPLETVLLAANVHM